MSLVARAALLAAIALAAGAAPAAAASSPWPRPLHYDATLRFVDRTHTLSGKERITFVNDGPTAVESLWLRVWPNGYGSCRHRYARVDGDEGAHAVDWAVGCTARRVRLATPVEPGAQGTVALRLRVRVPHRSDRFGRDHGITYLGNALPLLAVGPHLDPYTEIGDPFYSLDASWSVSLDVPRGLRAATTGVVQGQTGRQLSIVADHARDFAIVVGPFRVASATSATGVRLNRYRLRSQRRRTSLGTLRIAAKAMERLEKWYGPPAEAEVDLTPAPSSFGLFGAMEYPGLVMTPDRAVSITHELAHQWWYSLVGDDQWRSPWLDESFAEFSARRLPASVSGKDGLRCNPRNPVRRFGRGALDASMGHWNKAGGRAYGRIVYVGGTCALRSLEHDLGSAWMTSFLRSYVDAHRFGVTTTHDFVSALRAAAPPEYDVDAFLRRARIKGR